MHRDIKPSNLLLNFKGDVKISDFGIATMQWASAKYRDSAWVGSHCYMSPERLNAQEFDTSADVWGAGLTIVQTALGVFPFLADDIAFDRYDPVR